MVSSSWGLVKGDGAMKLLDFAVKNESEARDFMTQHGVWQEFKWAGNLGKK